MLLRITDDGVGGADQAGAGLSGLRDRIQALDGHLYVHSPHDAGTTVQARLPNHSTRGDSGPGRHEEPRDLCAAPSCRQVLPPGPS